MQDCIFCKIAKGEAPSFKVYEDEKYIAFLDKFPNPRTQAQTLVIPKEHVGSYAFGLDVEEFVSLYRIVHKVGKALDRALDIDRVCIIMEGYGVPHVHVKLFPIKHGAYEGTLSTELGPEASEQELKTLAEKIKQQLE